MDKNKLNMDENLTETDLIDHIDEAPLEHIIETLPVPVENLNISNGSERENLLSLLSDR